MLLRKHGFRKKGYSNFQKNHTQTGCDVVGSYPLFGTSRSTNVVDSFVPISLCKNQEREIYRDTKEIEKAMHDGKVAGSEVEVRREELTLSEAINSEGSGIALLGVAGSGKTTSFKQLAVLAAQGEKILGRERFPIFITVRDLDDSKSALWDGMVEYLNGFEIHKPRAVLWSLLKSGQAMILIDGIDETSEKCQKNIIREIVRLQSINRKRRDRVNVICVSGRPFSLSIGLSNFQKLEVMPLRQGLKREFITKWFEGLSDEKGRDLCGLVHSSAYLKDLSSTPLLLSIICALYDNELKLPERKEELLERAIFGLLGGWDYFRGISRATFLGDVSTMKRQVLVSKLAYELFIEKYIVFTLSDVRALQITSQALELIGLESIEESIVLSALYNDFGILIERSPEVYSFSHLSFQEYLVAKYVVDSRLENDLVNHALVRPEKYIDVMQYVANLLPRSEGLATELFFGGDWSNVETAKMIASFWNAKPIMSKEKRLELMEYADKMLIENLLSVQDSTVLFGYSSTANMLEVSTNKEDKVAVINSLLIFNMLIGRSLKEIDFDHSFIGFVRRYGISSMSGAKVNKDILGKPRGDINYKFF